MKEISKLEYIDKKKVKVYLDGQYFGFLYQGEVKRYYLKEGKFLDDNILNEIEEEIMLKRAKERALYILQKMDKTEYEISNKLRQNYYSDAIISRVVNFLKEYHYIDDYRYASTFFQYKEKNKSIRQIKEALYQKGISNDIINNILESYVSKETAAIQTLAAKKMRGRILSQMDRESVQKLVGYLVGKGFRYEDIKHVISNAELEE